ncbi:MAG: (2Fe-2S)-binding protein [Acidobacteriota bacterium]
MSLRIQLWIDDRAVSVPAGSNVAAAMLSLGGAHRSVHGEPRAPVCGMGVCWECRVWLDGIETRGCLLSAADGMRVRTDG